MLLYAFCICIEILGLNEIKILFLNFKNVIQNFDPYQSK